MSTGPGPTHKADGSSEASVDDIADLLVEGESRKGRTEGEQSLDDGLDVMLETPGPALVSTFMPPPPSPPAADDVAEDADDSAEEPGEATNLAYEDLLAKLVLPAKAPEPEPAMPALASSLPLPESLTGPAAPTPPAVAFKRPSSASLQVAPPSDERTLVTINPLVAEEQEAAAREGRAGSRELPPIMVQEEMRPALTEPMVAANGVAKSRLYYRVEGGLLVLGGMIVAVLLLKLIMPTPASQPPVVITPAALPAPPPPPPAHVEPLPPSVPPAAAAPAPSVAPAPAVPSEVPAPSTEEGAAPEGEMAQPKAHKAAARKVTHAAAPKLAPAPKQAVAPKAAPAPATAPAAKTAKAPTGKKAKASGYADPFDN
jgi:hypothetical protein